MSFLESVNRLYNDNKFDLLDVLNESVHALDLVLDWPEPNSSVLYGTHTGTCFYNHKNRMFEIIYDLSSDRRVFQAKREKVKYPIGLLMKYNNIERCYIHTNRWYQAYNDSSNQFIESKESHPVTNNNAVDVIRIQNFVIDNFYITIDADIFCYSFYPRRNYRPFQPVVFKQYVNVEDKIIAKKVIQEWQNNFFKDRQYESEDGEIRYRTDDLSLVFRGYLNMGRKMDSYTGENDTYENCFYFKVLEEHVVFLKKIDIILTLEILNEFAEECRKESSQYSHYPLLQMFYYLFYNRNGEISESICCLFNRCQNRKEAPKFCVGINTTYKITGRFLKLAFLSWELRVNS